MVLLSWGWKGKSKLSLESWETCARHCMGQLRPKELRA